MLPAAWLAAALALHDAEYVRTIVQRIVPVFDRLSQPGTCCRKGSRFWRFTSANGEHLRPESCIHLCRADPKCDFLSHSTKFENCVTCTGGCELNSTRFGKHTYSSWRRHNETRDVEVMFTDSRHVAKRGGRVGQLKDSKRLGLINAQSSRVASIAREAQEVQGWLS